MTASNRFFAALSTAYVVLLLALPVGAQDQSGTETGLQEFESSGWTVQCENNGTALQCAASMVITAAPQGQRIFSISLQEGGSETETTLVMQLPFGLNLREGVDLSIDGGEAQTFAFSTCLQAGCFVIEPANAELVAAMSAGELLTVSMQASDGNDTSMELPLTGFTEAYNRLN